MSFTARHAVFYGRMLSVVGRNVQLCSERLNMFNVNKLIDLKYIYLHFIDSECRSTADPLLLHQSALVWELMLARVNLVHVSDLSDSDFSSDGVVTTLDLVCVY